MPGSFSTCTMITVRCASNFLRWRISATNARLSASSVSLANGDAEPTVRPFAAIMRGYFAGSCFIHSGM